MTKPEVWLRGPMQGIPPLLQPVAHALEQAAEEVEEVMKNFPDALLWEKPADVASPGFHLMHLSGVLDRIFTYARGEQLTTEQLTFLEGETRQHDVITGDLVGNFRKQVDVALTQLASTDENSLTEFRGVGRKQIPSTVIGLLFHAAEHSQRHVGQLLVTVRVLKNSIHQLE